ncbi:kyphoscoliosis peptidase-like [Dreissena polymorpha]|uniref:kyphoscoliosis peptidase-like n=1 Tax=Dreissena polymorpha TaxID=45954 RepID=UPI00226408E5|nr:kyphoscoliosis peptidase-like [Dreissena polymorpha]
MTHSGATYSGSGRVRLDQPLAYRDEQGNLQLYKPGEAPTILKPMTPQETEIESSDTHSSMSIRDESQVGEEGRKSGVGETYTPVMNPPRLLSRNAQTSFVSQDDEIVVPVSPVPEVKTARRRRKDVMRNDMVFKEIDQHSMRAPPLTKESLPRLVEYLVAYADNSFEKVRAFYVWITHNINYDTSGYFNRAPLRPTDPDSVLANRVTVCEGYCRLFAAFCSEAEIPAKIICGYAKSYGYQPGDDVMSDSHNAHAWNSVYIDNDWFLVDVTWGAGFVKSKERKYVSRFTNAYFLTDPEVFITDHFPFPVKSFERYESDTKWQLLEKPLSALEFCSVVNFDQCGKDWGIRSLTHHKAIIYNIEYEIDIELETMHTNISDFLAFLYEGERKIDNFIFAYMPTDKTVRVHVCMPGRGVFTLQVYARRQRDSPHGDFQPIVKYILQCNKSFDQPLTYPTHHTLYGPVKELAKYGIDSIEQGVYHVADDGEIIFSSR